MQKHIFKPCSHIQKKYKKSEYHIQNNNVLYKIHQQYPNIFKTPEFRYIWKKLEMFKMFILYFVEIL